MSTREVRAKAKERRQDEACRSRRAGGRACVRAWKRGRRGKQGESSGDGDGDGDGGGDGGGEVMFIGRVGKRGRVSRTCRGWSYEETVTVERKWEYRFSCEEMKHDRIREAMKSGRESRAQPHPRTDCVFPCIQA